MSRDDQALLFEETVVRQLRTAGVPSVLKAIWAAIVILITGTATIVGIWYQNQAVLARLTEISAQQTAALKAHEQKLESHALTLHSQALLLAVHEDRLRNR